MFVLKDLLYGQLKHVFMYCQACIRQTLLGQLKRGRLGKRPQTKSNRSWQVFYIKIFWNKDLQLRMSPFLNIKNVLS